MAPKVVVCCIAVARWAPVLFITAIVVWSYYAYVVQMCLFTVDSVAEKVVYLIFFHPLLFMFAWTYWKIIFTNVKAVPEEFYLSGTVLEQFERAPNVEVQKEILIRFSANLPVMCRTINGAPRYCEKCKSVKPDRSHHCSVCGRCILKMDHHCPWVNNCVGHTNYKFFILFLFYAFIYCVYVGATSLQYFIRFWTGIAASPAGDMQSLHIVFLFFASVMFAISLVVLLGYHCALVASNRSTLEAFRAPIFTSGPDKDGFSVGCCRNMKEVFGDDKRWWLLPVYSSNGDGVVYPTRFVANTQQHATYLSMDNTQQISNGSVQTPGEDAHGLLSQQLRSAEEGDADGAATADPV